MPLLVLWYRVPTALSSASPMLRRNTMMYVFGGALLVTFQSQCSLDEMSY